MGEADAISSKLQEVRVQLEVKARKKRQLESEIAQLEELVRAMEISLTAVGVLPTRPETAAALALAGRRSGRTSILDAVLAAVQPGEELSTEEITDRVLSRTDITLNRSNPKATVGAVVSRAREHFRQIRRGRYQRIDGAPTETGSPSPDRPEEGDQMEL